MDRRHNLEKRDMVHGERVKAMKAALRKALRQQRRLNKARDKAAIAAGFVPPSADSWTVRFRYGRLHVS